MVLMIPSNPDIHFKALVNFLNTQLITQQFKLLHQIW